MSLLNPITMSIKYDFKKVKEHLLTLPTSKEKLTYLINIRYDFLQEKPEWELESTSFDKLCDLEIERIQRIRQINAYYFDQTKLD